MRIQDLPGPTLIVRHTGQRFPLTQGPVTVGREEDNIIVLGDSRASRHHATISYRAGAYIIQDLKSANGTYVNERRVVGTQTLHQGDTVRIGSTLLEIHLPAGSDPNETIQGLAVGAGLARGHQTERGLDVQTPARTRRGSPGAIVIMLLLIVGILVLGGALIVYFLQSRDGGGTPQVAVQAPANGSQVAAGSQVSLEAVASGRQDLKRLELLLDGALVAIAGSSEARGSEVLNVSALWVFDRPGTHIISARVLAGSDEISQSEPVTLLVLEDVAQITPSSPLATDTPASVPATAEPPTPEPPTAEIATPEAPTSQAPTAEAPTGEATIAPPPTSTPSPTVAPPTNSPGGGGQSRPAGPGPITGFEEWGTWKRGAQANGTFSQSTEQVHGGSYAGKLAYSFPSGSNDFVVFQQTYLLGGRPNQVSAWVYGDAQKHYLNVWIQDAAGEIWQFPFGQVRHSGWQQMAARLDPGAAWPAGHIDGPSNGAIDYPINFRALVLDDVPDSFNGSGAIYLDDLRCDESSAPPPPTATQTPTPGASSQAPVMQFWADSTTIAAGETTWLRWHVEHVTAIYLEGEPVTGPDGSRKVRPSTTTTYRLRVVYAGGEEILKVTVVVN